MGTTQRFIGVGAFVVLAGCGYINAPRPHTTEVVWGEVDTSRASAPATDEQLANQELSLRSGAKIVRCKTSSIWGSPSVVDCGNMVHRQKVVDYCTGRGKGAAECKDFMKDAAPSDLFGILVAPPAKRRYYTFGEFHREWYRGSK